MTKNLQRSQETFARLFNRRSKPSTIREDDLVLVENHRRPLGLSQKMVPKFDGLYRVVKIDQEASRRSGTTVNKYHLSQCKRCLSPRRAPTRHIITRKAEGEAIRDLIPPTLEPVHTDFFEISHQIHPNARADDPASREWYCIFCSRQYQPVTEDGMGWYNALIVFGGSVMVV